MEIRIKLKDLEYDLLRLTRREISLLIVALLEIIIKQEKEKVRQEILKRIFKIVKEIREKNGLKKYVLRTKN